MFGRFGSLHSHHQHSSLHAAASVNKYGRRLLGEMLGSEGACERFQDKQYLQSLPDDSEMLEHELEAQLRDLYEHAQGGKDDNFWCSYRCSGHRAEWGVSSKFDGQLVRGSIPAHC